jgi:hypothetical protein
MQRSECKVQTVIQRNIDVYYLPGRSTPSPTHGGCSVRTLASQRVDLTHWIRRSSGDSGRFLKTTFYLGRNFKTRV